MGSCALIVTIQHGVKILEALKSHDNPVKDAAMPGLNEKAQKREQEVRENESRRLEHERKARESRQEAMGACEGSLDRFVPYSEHVALYHPTTPPLARAWREDAWDEVLGRGSRFAEMP